MDLTELELIDELHLNDDNEFDGVIPGDILARFADSDAEFSAGAPVLSVVKLVSTKKISSLGAAGVEHYDTLEKSGIMPAIVKTLQSELANLEALDFLAFAKYEKQSSLELPEMDPLAEFHHFDSVREYSYDATPAGYATQKVSSMRKLPFAESQRGYFGSRPWLLQFFIESQANTNRQFVDKWWALVVPALLNFLDTGDVGVKTRAVRLVDSLATHHGERLRASGLAPVFESSIEPCLSFLPPLVEVPKTKLVHRPALKCLVKLAQTYSLDRLKYNARINFLARDGCLKPFLHANEKVELFEYFLKSLQNFINHALQSLTIVHLHGIIQVCNQILTDPFVDVSAELVNCACGALEAAIKWAWPCIEKYRYTIMFGLAKANALDTPVFAMLKPTREEAEGIRAAVKQS